MAGFAVFGLEGLVNDPVTEAGFHLFMTIQARSAETPPLVFLIPVTDERRGHQKQSKDESNRFQVPETLISKHSPGFLLSLWNHQ